MSFFSMLLLLSVAWMSVMSEDTPSSSAIIKPPTRRPPFPKMDETEDDSTKMQVVVVLLVAFCVSLAITVIIRFLRKYSERQRLYSSFN